MNYLKLDLFLLLVNARYNSKMIFGYGEALFGVLKTFFFKEI